MTLPEIGIVSGLSLGVVASAALAVMLWPIGCIVLLGFLGAGIWDDGWRAVRR